MSHAATTLNLAMLLEHQARLRPETPAVVMGEHRFTYGQIDALAGRIAHALRARGIRRGQHVALSCPNVPYFPMVYYGILKAGAAVVPLNVLLKSREIAYHLRDSDAVAYFCFEGTNELPMAGMGRAAFDEVEACREMVVLPAAPTAPSPLEGLPTLQAFIEGHPPLEEGAPTRPDDTAVVLYTSGTTGQPKGAELSHLNMVMNAIVSRDLQLQTWDVRPEGRNVALITLPLFHSFGQTCQMNAMFYGGGTIVLLPRFDPAVVLETLRAEQITCWAGVPTMFWTLLQHVEKTGADLRAAAASLRVAFSGGAPMPVELLARLEKAWDARILEGYGLSETAPVATFNQMQRPSRPGTVGLPVFAVDVACLDERGSAVPAGSLGEVAIRGHNIMKGYYNRPDATNEVTAGGWFRSGDLGTIDEAGYVTIVDRKKDMILRGGFNVYPRELEEELMAHPDVSLCAVVGVPDERLGEEIKAYIVPRPGTSLTVQELGAWCQERIAAYKVPRLFEFRETLPMNATGKILKRELRRPVSPTSK